MEQLNGEENLHLQGLCRTMRVNSRKRTDVLCRRQREREWLSSETVLLRT